MGEFEDGLIYAVDSRSLGDRYVALHVILLSYRGCVLIVLSLHSTAKRLVIGPQDAVPSGMVALLGDLFDNPVEKFAIDRRAGHRKWSSITTILK